MQLWTPLTLPVSFSPKSFRSVLISLRRYESATIGERKDIKTGGVDNTLKKHYHLKINNIKKPLIAILIGLLTLSLTLFAQPAHAVACSKFDQQMWSKKKFDNVNYLAAKAYISGSEEDVILVLDKLDIWVAKTKSKKVKAAVKMFMIEFEKGAVLGDWKSNPKYTSALKTLASMFNLNRC